MKRTKFKRKPYRRRRFSEASVQDDKYSPAADALIHRNNLRKVRPFNRNEPLDNVERPKYGQVSIERREVELRFREVVLERYLRNSFHHRVELWKCKWLFGRPDSAHSIRMLFCGAQAILIRYDRGILERSNIYGSVDRAMLYFELYTRGRKLTWLPIDEPLPLSVEPTPSVDRFGNPPKRLKDFEASIKPDEEGNEVAKYKPVIGKGAIRTNNYIRIAVDALPSPLEPEDD